MHKTARELIRRYVNLSCDTWTPYGVRAARVEEVYEAVKAEVLKDLRDSQDLSYAEIESRYRACIAGSHR